MNILLGACIPEVLLNLVSFHGFMEKPNSTVILNFQFRLVNNYSEKRLFFIENNSKQLSILPNDAKLRIHAIEQVETYFCMAKNKAISSVENTIKKLPIHFGMYFINQQNLYYDKQDEIDTLFD